MYLVHARLWPGAQEGLPVDAASLVSRCAGPDDGLEYVVAHGETQGGPVLGMFLLSESLAQAEAVAADICQRALRAHESLRGFRLHSCEAAMPAPYYDLLLNGPDADPLS